MHGAGCGVRDEGGGVNTTMWDVGGLGGGGGGGVGGTGRGGEGSRQG